MVLEGKIGMLSAVGIDINETDSLKWISKNQIDYENNKVHQADIFIDGSDFIYIINHESMWDTGAKIELGIISDNPAVGKKKLYKYAEQISEAINSTIDKRKVRIKDKGWYINGPNWEITSRCFPEGKFIKSSFQEEEINAAELFKENSIKEFLYNIGDRKIYISTPDQNKEVISEILSDTISYGIVSHAVQIKCSNKCKSQKIILTDKNYEWLNLGEYCPSCNNQYNKKVSIMGYAITPLGIKLKNGSHWMTILLTACLFKNGVSLDKIIWSLEKDGEEVDCVVDFKGKIWIFELKDKTFPAGKAHPFLYRAIKYKADKIIIVTTESLGPDAKRIFKDISREYRGNFELDKITYIEGLENMDTIISKMINDEIKKQINQKHKELKLLTSVDFYPVIEKQFGSYFHKPEKQ